MSVPSIGGHLSENPKGYSGITQPIKLQNLGVRRYGNPKAAQQQ